MYSNSEYYRCYKCNKEYKKATPEYMSHGDVAGMYAQHDSYGCASGCCGHRLTYVTACGTETGGSHWEFSHPYRDSYDKPISHEEIEKFVRDLDEGKHPNAKVLVDWCEVSDD